MATETIGVATTGNAFLTMSLQRPGVESEHAVISLPKSYEDAVAAAHEIFDLGSKSIDQNGIQLRRSVQDCHSKTEVWARIFPREWEVAVRPHIDGVAVFLKEDENEWEMMRTVAGQEVNLDGSGKHPKLIRLIAVRFEKRDNTLQFIVSAPKTYEDCQSIAHGLMTPKGSKTRPDQLILKGTFPNVTPAKLVPSAYSSYVNLPGAPVEVLVYDWH